MTCFADARAEEAFLPATLEAVRPCAARPEYVELCFSTPEGAWNWCFPRPPRRRRRPGGPIALRPGPYGVHAYRLGEDGPGDALEISAALPMIRAGADVYVARGLVVTGGRGHPGRLRLLLASMENAILHTMEFELDEDQRLLQQVVRETVAKSRSQPPDQLWRTYQDLGWLEAPPVELAIVLEELGYAADPTPFLSAATWFAPLAGRLPRGTGTGVCDGTGRFVLDADRADEIALVTSRGVVIASGAEVRTEPVATFDPTLRLAHVAATGLVPRIPDLTLMGLAVTTVGACRHILDLAVAHVKQRVQFGVPIGSFQAVKHKAADMYVAIERARALAYFCALTIAEDDPRRARAALMAKAAAGECQRVVFKHGLQLFGGMGFTWENELQLYLKRAKACDLLLGTASVHRKALLAMEEPAGDRA